LDGRANLGVLFLRQHATTPTAAATAATATAAAGLRRGLKCGRAKQGSGHRHYQKCSLFHAILLLFGLFFRYHPHGYGQRDIMSEANRSREVTKNGNTQFPADAGGRGHREL
jgi:hypothetical protein